MLYENMLSRLASAPSPISNEEYRHRQQMLLARLDTSAALLLCANPQRLRTNDVHHPARTNSDLLYLCGCADEGAVLLAMHSDEGWTVTLFVQARDIEKEIWEGRRLGVEGAAASFPIHEALPRGELEEVLSVRLQDAGSVYHRIGLDESVDRIVERSINDKSRARQQLGQGPDQQIDPSGLLAELRLRKSEAEIEHMRHSARISSLAHLISMQSARPEMGEWQLQALIEGFFRYAGADQWAYPSIVGSGDNATVLHYTSNQDACRDGEVVLIDAGSEYKGYAADITRSWPVNGKFTVEQRQIYDLVLKAQLAAIAEVRAGRPYLAPHHAARRILAEGLVELGIIDGSAEQSLDNGELQKYYMHGTGHWLGLDVHDVGVYRPDGEPRLFEPGMVITVEPGLYFGAWRPDLEGLDPRWAGIGIRIEDDVLVTEDGPDVLSSDCPKDPDELEALIGTA